MRDQELHDLLHERVADLTMPDVSQQAWGRARRIRRRRTTAAVAGAVAAVVVTAVAVNGGAGPLRSDGPLPPASQVPTPDPSTGPTTGPSTGPTTGPDTGPDEARARAATAPDGRYRGWRVYWGPLVDQEPTLPRASSPFPDTVDLSTPAPDLADRPISSALAAYAVTDDAGGTRLLLLAPDGTLRSVDTSRVAPLDDGAGTDVSVARDTLLSPTGEYLAFPQPGGVLVLTLATGAWRAVDTGDRVTTTLQWSQDTELWLPRTSQGGWGPLYSALDGTRSGAEHLVAPAAPFDVGAGPYGRWHLGPGGMAQSWARVPGLPVLRGEITPSQVLLVQGDVRAHDALLVLSAASTPQEQPRPDFCCGAAFWLERDVVVYGSGASPGRLVAWRVGTHEVRRVTTIGGYDPDREVVDSSYAAVWQ